MSSPSAIREALKKGPIALLIAATTVFLAACNQVGTDHITFWDIVYSMVFFFFIFLPSGSSSRSSRTSSGATTCPVAGR